MALQASLTSNVKRAGDTATLIVQTRGRTGGGIIFFFVITLSIASSIFLSMGVSRAVWISMLGFVGFLMVLVIIVTQVLRRGSSGSISADRITRSIRKKSGFRTLSFARLQIPPTATLVMESFLVRVELPSTTPSSAGGSTRQRTERHFVRLGFIPQSFDPKVGLHGAVERAGLLMGTPTLRTKPEPAPGLVVMGEGPFETMLSRIAQFLSTELDLDILDCTGYPRVWRPENIEPGRTKGPILELLRSARADDSFTEPNRNPTFYRSIDRNARRVIWCGGYSLKQTILFLLGAAFFTGLPGAMAWLISGSPALLVTLAVVAISIASVRQRLELTAEGIAANAVVLGTIPLGSARRIRWEDVVSIDLRVGLVIRSKDDVIEIKMTESWHISWVLRQIERFVTTEAM